MPPGVGGALPAVKLSGRWGGQQIHRPTQAQGWLDEDSSGSTSKAKRPARRRLSPH